MQVHLQETHAKKICYNNFMVRLINENNIKTVCSIVYSILHTQERFTYIREINNPGISPCIYVMWHENQFGVYGVPNVRNTNILISNSLDGQIVASGAGSLGFKICRGSSGRKGAVASTLNLIEKLKSGEDVAIMVDGPRGPYREVKHGAIVLARETGIPIVPMHMYSDEFTFVQFPSWDKMYSPIGPCHILILFGDPIYVGDKSDEEVAQEVKDSLLSLESAQIEKYKEAKKNKLWSKKE